MTSSHLQATVYTGPRYQSSCRGVLGARSSKGHLVSKESGKVWLDVEAIIIDFTLASTQLGLICTLS